ncbi:hypothetical protein [Acaryochloris marina]|uniref:Uncharacterized protein n=1 Tax=Acaryochloris marina (strain MBIC 11017) TaxID=329726 RepID=B0CCU5_ACAM1|nr:hypothetical protein [Acaryochloris marina]ABW30387.1 hypothetical protein AM1_5431 [Acaryochloris marina MBIC11017]BDM79206.1 hypothetical protein AM10699_20740 [Acaryochloris marina MBIC10699]
MISTNFIDNIGSKLSDPQFSSFLAPSFIFWFGGLLAYINKYGITSLELFLNQYSEISKIIFLIFAFILITLSAFLVKSFDLSLLRLLEGYWPIYMQSLKKILIARKRKLISHAEHHWQQLAVKKELSNLTRDEHELYIRLDQNLRQYPTDPMMLMPTKLGNILRSHESQTLSRFGLDANVCWPRLWLLLPEKVKFELQSARSDLYISTRLFFWSCIFSFWGIWLWWAFPLSIISVFICYQSILKNASIFGCLCESTFDLYRRSLYDSLGWSLPTNLSNEHESGLKLSEFFWRGTLPILSNMMPEGLD